MTRTSTFAANAATAGKTIVQLFGAAAIGAAVLAVPAQAAVIDFEGYGGLVGGSEFIQTKGIDVGFFSNVVGGEGSLVGNFIDGSDRTACVDMACPVNNATTYYGALNDSYLDLTSTNPLLRLQVKSFDASFIGAFAALSGYPSVAGLLRIQGFLNNGTSISETYQLAGPSAAGFNFGHYDTTASFGSQLFTEVAIFGFVCNTAGSCSAFTSDQGQFGIDNINLAQVPEPASLALFGLGLVGLTVAARRRKA